MTSVSIIVHNPCQYLLLNIRYFLGMLQPLHVCKPAMRRFTVTVGGEVGLSHQISEKVIPYQNGFVGTVLPDAQKRVPTVVNPTEILMR